MSPVRIPAARSARDGYALPFTLPFACILLSLMFAVSGCVRYSSSDEGGEGSSGTSSEKLDQLAEQVGSIDAKLNRVEQQLSAVANRLQNSQVQLNPGGTIPPEDTLIDTTDVAIPDDIPAVPLLADIEGIPVPRLKVARDSSGMNGPRPFDVDNPFAKGQPTKPVTGGQLSIRFNSEPKRLNPITESSAVQTYMMEYVNEPLVWQNLDTLEFEPFIAKRWVGEDSVKLAANYAGYERQLQIDGGQIADKGQLTYKNPEQPKDGDKIDPPTLNITTLDKAGKPAANTWVGLFRPADPAANTPKRIYHFWSDKSGNVEIVGIEDGDYDVKVGVEIYGKSLKQSDDGLIVTPLTDENPLHEMLKTDGKPALELTPADYVDVQRETVFTYYLREDVTWSDGKPFTTKDLEFAYAVINNPIVDGDSIRVYYHDLVECNGLTPYVVRMKYREQYFNAFEFTYSLSMYTPPVHVFEEIVPEEMDGAKLTFQRLTEKEEIEQKLVSVHGGKFAKFFNTDTRYNTKPMGTGPYIVKQWDQNNRVVLERRSDYWNSEKAGYLDRINCVFIEDTGTAMTALKAGEIDFFWLMTAEQMHEQLSPSPGWFSKDYVKASWYSPGYSYYGWNSRNELFQDARVRMALSLAVDKSEFIDKKLYGEGVIVSGSQYYFGPAYDHNVPPLAYDPEAARDILAEAGWIDSDGDGVLDKDGKPFRFTLLMSVGSQVSKDFATIYKKELSEIGVEMEINALEWAAFLEKIQNKDYDATTLRWAQSLESDPFQLWHSSEAVMEKRSSNHVSFRSRQGDELIERIRLTVDKPERLALQHAFHRLLDREQPYMFLFCQKDLGAYHKRFRGVKWYRLRPGFNLREWYVPKELQKKN